MDDMSLNIDKNKIIPFTQSQLKKEYISSSLESQTLEITSGTFYIYREILQHTVYPSHQVKWLYENVKVLTKLSIVCRLWKIVAETLIANIIEPHSFLKNLKEQCQIKNLLEAINLYKNWREQLFEIDTKRVSYQPFYFHRHDFFNLRKKIKENAQIKDSVQIKDKIVYLIQNPSFYEIIIQSDRVKPLKCYLIEKQICPLIFVSKDQHFIALQRKVRIITNRRLAHFYLFTIYLLHTFEIYGKVKIMEVNTPSPIANKKPYYLQLQQVEFDAKTFSYCLDKILYTRDYTSFKV